MPIELLSDEQASAIWSGDTASLLNFETNSTETNELNSENEDSEKEKNIIINEEELNNVWIENSDEDDSEDEKLSKVDESNIQKNNVQTQSTTDVKKGRKPADIVNVVNQLIEEDVLFGFEGEDIKTIDDVKELIKANLKYKEDNVFENLWKKKLEGYSPQVQAIIEYAEKGGQDLSSLIGAITEVEKSISLDLETEEGQTEIIRQTLKLKGFDDDEINEQIETFKDLDRLQAKAEKFLPELNKRKEEQVQMILEEQNRRQESARQASAIYNETIAKTLEKEKIGTLKLKMEDKASIFDSLTLPKHKSLNGFPINGFVKVLEELQFGKNQDYEHFLNIVHLTIDKDGFMERFKESLNDEFVSKNVKKLKTAKETLPNTEEVSLSNRKTIAKSNEFKNPFRKN